MVAVEGCINKISDLYTQKYTHYFACFTNRLLPSSLAHPHKNFTDHNGYVVQLDCSFQFANQHNCSAKQQLSVKI